MENSVPLEEEEDLAPQVEGESLLDQTDAMERLAEGLLDAMPKRALPKQEYLQETVVPILVEGLSWLIKKKPEDPVEHLAMFLIKNNPLTPELNRTIDLSEYE